MLTHVVYPACPDRLLLSTPSWPERTGHAWVSTLAAIYLPCAPPSGDLSQIATREGGGEGGGRGRIICCHVLPPRLSRGFSPSARQGECGALNRQRTACRCNSGASCPQNANSPNTRSFPRRRSAPVQLSTEVALFESFLALAAEWGKLPISPLFARQTVFRFAIVAKAAGLQATVNTRPAERLNVADSQRLEHNAIHLPVLRHGSREQK